MASNGERSGVHDGEPKIVDDKSQYCIPFILRQLQTHQWRYSDKPFFIGLNGVQGAGKTTIVRELSLALCAEGHETLVISIDDLYLTHADQQALARRHPDNALIQHRGEPGTHDIPLAKAIFTFLKISAPTAIPRYSKSLQGGRGDRLPTSDWDLVNHPGQPKVKVIIFEGWCVGFRALHVETLRWKEWSNRLDPDTVLPRYKNEDLEFVNVMLRDYDCLWEYLDVFIHIDALDIKYVYDWRREQEDELRREKGPENAMTDEEVIRFVDGYYPAYELYTDDLRKGVFQGREDKKGCQLRLQVGPSRRVIEKEEI